MPDTEDVAVDQIKVYDDSDIDDIDYVEDELDEIAFDDIPPKPPDLDVQDDGDDEEPSP